MAADIELRLKDGLAIRVRIVLGDVRRAFDVEQHDCGDGRYIAKTACKGMYVLQRALFFLPLSGGKFSSAPRKARHVCLRRAWTTLWWRCVELLNMMVFVETARRTDASTFFLQMSNRASEAASLACVYRYLLSKSAGRKHC